jgi:hypothetical protein
MRMTTRLPSVVENLAGLIETSAISLPHCQSGNQRSFSRSQWRLPVQRARGGARASAAHAARTQERATRAAVRVVRGKPVCVQAFVSGVSNAGQVRSCGYARYRLNCIVSVMKAHRLIKTASACATGPAQGGMEMTEARTSAAALVLVGRWIPGPSPMGLGCRVRAGMPAHPVWALVVRSS